MLFHFIENTYKISGESRQNTLKVWGYKNVPAALKIVFFVLFTSFAHAQEVQFTASAPSVVAAGEQFRLVYTINTRAENIRLPDLGLFRLISGPATSSSSSVQIINGEMTQSRSVTYTYVLGATEEGNYTIGPASITAGEDQYTSNSVSIEVVSGSAGQGTGREPAGPDATADRSLPDIAGDDIFVRILLDKKEVFQGEGILATIKLYSKLDLTGIENVRFPAFSGFYQQDIETPPLRSLDREVINGEIYGTGILKQMLLFPQRNGEIKIEPFGMDAVVRQRVGRRGSLFDDFFGGTESRRIPVESPPLTLKVKPLPGERPEGFSGGVGSFSLSAEIEPERPRSNEAITMRLTISGQGNLRLLRQPEIDFPHGFEVYDPNVSEAITNSPAGQQGKITWEYLIIPRSTGNFSIPSLQFSYFDPAAAQYRSTGTGEFHLLVEQGDDSGGGIAAAGYAREDLRIIGRDIRFIKTSGVVLKQTISDPFGSFPFYLWFIIPLVFFIAFISVQKKNIRDRADIARMKNRRAGKVARRRLKSAGSYLREDDSRKFFDETLRAIWGYLSDKLLIPVSDLNRQNLKSALIEKNIPKKDVERLIGIIDDCEFARYAPSSSPADKNIIYNDTIKIITLIEQNIRQ